MVTDVSIIRKLALDYLILSQRSVYHVHYVMTSFVPWVCGGRYWPVLCSVSPPDYLSLLTSYSIQSENLHQHPLFFGVNELFNIHPFCVVTLNRPTIGSRSDHIK